MTQEPYWRIERYLDGAGQWHDRWQPSREMTYLLGCLLSTQDDIEGATMQRPTLVLLPADKGAQRLTSRRDVDGPAGRGVRQGHRDLAGVSGAGTRTGPVDGRRHAGCSGERSAAGDPG